MFVTLVLMLACADPHDFVLPANEKAWADNEKLKETIQKLPPEEQDLLREYLTRKLMSEALGGTGLPPMGVTLGDAVKEQRAWKAAQEQAAAEAAALAAKVAAEREAKQARMNDAMTVAVTSLAFRPSNYNVGRYSDTIALAIAFENKADQKASGVKGAVRFADLFGDEIKTVGVSFDEGVAPHATAVWKAELRYNQFVASDVKLGNTPLEKLKITWLPSVILYADGTSLVVVE
jgi:hypothetical protein